MWLWPWLAKLHESYTILLVLVFILNRYCSRLNLPLYYFYFKSFVVFSENMYFLFTFYLTFYVGAHTLGFSHCNQFSKRIYSKAGIDPTLNRQYALELRKMCPVNVDPRIAINMDPTTPRTFDNAYYKNLQQGKGLFTSDQVLHTDTRSRPTVNLFASNNNAFNQAFITAITKLGRVGVLTGNQGEIRRDCSKVN